MKNRRTSVRVGREASKVLKHSPSKIVKSVAGSALSQRAPKRRK